MIEMTVTFSDGHQEIILLEKLISVGVWAEEHHGEFIGISFKPIKEAKQ